MVHLVTAFDPHHEHTQSGVLDAGDDAVIAYPVLPELAQLGTLEGLPDANDSLSSPRCLSLSKKTAD